MTNPFLFNTNDENLSCYERNGVFLNVSARQFHNISFVSGADSEGDGRSVTAWDVTGDGMQDLLVRQAGGGPLIVFENRFPKANWMAISLRGKDSNSFGIGSRLVCQTDHKTIHRELYPVVNFLSQSPAKVYFGLGDAEKVVSLKISWPSGLEQTLTNLAANQHYLITEGSAAAEKVVPEP